MPESLFITRVEFNQLKKDIAYLTEYVRNSMRQGSKSKWVKPAEAMELIGCKKTKLENLRMDGTLNWRYAGKGRGVMILRSSIERYNVDQSTITMHEKSRQL